MLAKVIKHEYQATKFIVWCVTGAAFLPGFVFFLLYLFPFSGKGVLITGITIMLVTTVAANVFGFVYLLLRYYQTVHGQAAYQTFTIPVNPRTIYWGKIIYWFLINIILGSIFAVFIISYFYMAASLWDFSLSQVLSEIFNTNINSISPTTIILGVAYSLFYELSSVIIWAFFITCGNSWKFRSAGPVGGSIIVVVIYSVITGIISTITAFIPGTIVLKADASFQTVGLTLSATPAVDSQQAITGMATLLFAILTTIVAYLLTSYLLTKRLQLR